MSVAEALTNSAVLLCVTESLKDVDLARIAPTCTLWQTLIARVLAKRWTALIQNIRECKATCWAQISVGSLGCSCLIVEDGVARCCGTDYDGELGVGACQQHWSACWFSELQEVSQAAFNKGAHVISASIGFRHSIYATDDGRLFCSGVLPGYGSSGPAMEHTSQSIMHTCAHECVMRC